MTTDPVKLPIRVQRTRKAGRPGIPPGAKYVGRGTKWGNPWAVTLDPDRGWRVHPADDKRVLSDRIVGWWEWRTNAAVEAVERYRDHLKAHPELVEAAPRELAGQDLACWCPLPHRGDPDHCHAAVLLELANTPTP